MVKSLLSLLSARQTNILSGAFILMVTVFASKFLGLIKSRLLLHFFDTNTTDIFFAAFSMPDFIFQLLIFGALSVAFIPIFTSILHQDGEKKAFRFASNILNLCLVVFFIVALFAFIFTPFLNSIFLPGFEGPKKDLTDTLTRIILFSQLILIVGSFFIALAQSYQRFIIPALAPVFYNMGIIFGIAFLSPYYGIAGPAIGVVIGAFLHLIIQIPLIRSLKFEYKFSFNFFELGVKEILKMISIRNISLIAEQITERVNIALATLLGASAVTSLTLSQNLYLVPIGLFGATIAQAALPVLSREKARGEQELFKSTLLTTFHQILFLTLPAAAILIVLRVPVVRLVYGASQFDWQDTVLTGRTVAFFALGLTAQSVIQILIRSFYALKDLKTPVIVSIVGAFVNISLSLLFINIWKLPIWSLGLSSAIAINITGFSLLLLLQKKVGGFEKRMLFLPALKMLVAALTAALALYIPIKALDQLVFDTTKTVNLITLTGIASIFGLSIYILLVWLMDVKELSTFINLLKKVGSLQKNIKSEEVVSDQNNI